MSRQKTLLQSAAAIAICLAVPALAQPDPLAEAFRDPPLSARPRVWWHWMNGNITEDGIGKDLAWMKRIGIGGVQNFDADLSTPQIVDKRLIYMSPDWKRAFRFAASEAERLGLELAVASSPGFSETGGPWVKPEDGLKKIVWSETLVEGGKRFSSVLAVPPGGAGPFQTALNHDPTAPAVASANLYRDIAVLAYPAAGNPMGTATFSDANGKVIDATQLTDGDLETGNYLASGAQWDAGYRVGGLFSGTNC